MVLAFPVQRLVPVHGPRSLVCSIGVRQDPIACSAAEDLLPVVAGIHTDHLCPGCRLVNPNLIVFTVNGVGSSSRQVALVLFIRILLGLHSPLGNWSPWARLVADPCPGQFF